MVSRKSQVYNLFISIRTVEKEMKFNVITVESLIMAPFISFVSNMVFYLLLSLYLIPKWQSRTQNQIY